MKRLATFPFAFLLCLSAYASHHRDHKKHVPPRRPAAATPADTTLLDHILWTEDQRISGDKTLRDAVYSPSPIIARAAILALARIGDPNGVEPLLRILETANSEKRELAAFALSEIGGDFAKKMLGQEMQLQRNAAVRAALLIGMGRVGDEKTQSVFQEVLYKESDWRVLAAAAQGLGMLWSQSPGGWTVDPKLSQRLIQFSRGYDWLATSAAFALSRYPGDLKDMPADLLMDATAHATSPTARAYLCRVLAHFRSAVFSAFLSRLALSDPANEVRIEAIKALSGQALSETVIKALVGAMNDPNHGIAAEALQTVAALGPDAKALSPEIQKLFTKSSSLWLKRLSLQALTKTDPALANGVAEAILKTAGNPLFANAMASLAEQSDPKNDTRLASYLQSARAFDVETVIQPLSDLPPGKIDAPMRQALVALLFRHDMGITVAIADLATKGGWKDFAVPLIQSYDFFSQTNEAETRVSLLSALGVLGDARAIPVAQRGLKDDVRVVQQSAAEALRRLTGKDYTQSLPLNGRVHAETPTWVAAQAALKEKVQISTSRGAIELSLLSEAPITAFHFLQLIRAHFYDGLTFHRVIPDFVAQGGDPRGDGFGGPKDFIRDEVSPVSHRPGIVGIATAGKDTGGSQFFLDLAPNLHLDGRYTAFAKIVKGLDIAQSLEEGDTIVSITAQ